MSDTVQMKPHFRKAIAEIDEDIAGLQNDITRLTNAREAIVELYGGDTEIPDVPKAAKKSVPRAPRAAGTGDSTGAGSGRAATPDTIKLMAATRTCAEPFTAASLHVASGLDKKFCANRLWKWEQKKFITKTAPGEYKRTATFPAAD